MIYLAVFALLNRILYDEVIKSKEDATKKPKIASKITLVEPDAATKKTDKSVEIFDMVIDGTQLNRVLSKIWLQRKEMLHVATVNPEFVMEARHNQKFREALGKCLRVADGYGIKWAAKILKGRDIDRISGSELVDKILEHASFCNEKVFLLGAGPGVALKAAQEMMLKYPGLQVAWFAGAQTVKVEKDEEASMTIAKINSIEPDYLFVAYGSPWQDIWIEENRPYLRCRVAIGVGGVLDEWVGRVSVAPKWIDQIGMKWLWRVVHEPRRIGRIFKVFYFAALVLYHKTVD